MESCKWSESINFGSNHHLQANLQYFNILVEKNTYKQNLDMQDRSHSYLSATGTGHVTRGRQNNNPYVLSLSLSLSLIQYNLLTFHMQNNPLQIHLSSFGGKNTGIGNMSHKWYFIRQLYPIFCEVDFCD